jgi:signal recognition particle receptor subunit beta
MLLQPSAPRIALVGAMGVGKTTAIRTVCGNLAVDCDVPNLDRESHQKATTTVGVDFGELDFGDGDKLQLYGCPGQERFDFVRHWVLSVCVGAFVMVELQQAGAVPEAAQLLREMQDSAAAPLPVVLVARPASDAEIDAFSQALEQQGFSAVPILQADVRDRQQMLDAIEVLVSMLSLKDQH